MRRVETMIPMTESRIASVTVVMHEPPQPGDSDEAAALAKLATMSIRRAYSVEACEGHEWDVVFPAAYLGGREDALCRCGARRSDTEGVVGSRG